MDPETTVLLIRLALSSASGFLIGLALVVNWKYFKSWTKRRHDWRGLLPLHVAAISASYLLLLISATVEIMIRTGNGDNHVSWRAFVLTPAYVLGVVAMFIIGKFRRERRLHLPKDV